MPTARHRYLITETDDLAVALDAAATLWPHARGDRTELLRLIIKQGAQVVEEDVQELRNERLAAVTQLAEDFRAIWPDDSDKQSTQEWSE